MSIVSLLILILFFIICIFVKFYTIQPSSCNSITNKLSIYLSIWLNSWFWNGWFQKISVPYHGWHLGIPKAWGGSWDWSSEGMGGFLRLEFHRHGGGGGVSILISKGVKELEIRLTMLIAFGDCSTNASHRLEAHGIHLLVGDPGKWQLPVTWTLDNPHRISRSVEPK